MENDILNLIGDDYFSLWEVRDVMSRIEKYVSFEQVKRSMINLVIQGKALCYVSPSLTTEGLVLVNGPEAVILLESNENWLVPSEGSAKIVRVTAANNI